LQLLDIIGDEPGFLAVNKPQDLVCHPTKGDAYSSLISRARLHLGGEAFLVNRLDRETSGVVLIAKTAVMAGALGKLFEQGAVRKAYIAAVHGHVAPDEGLVEAPLGKDQNSPVAVKDCVRADGGAASTGYVVQRRFVRDGQPFSILQINPLSGRKHQIRIHLAHIGHPIVGDKLYGLDEGIYLRFVTHTITEEDVRRLILPNQALHAAGVSFEWDGTPYQFQAKMPPSLSSFMTS
jgi:23S rRNA pseudouridine1911/1915/1917 synthase